MSRACRAPYPNYRAPFVFDPGIVSRAKANFAFLVVCHSIEMAPKTKFLYQRSSKGPRFRGKRISKPSVSPSLERIERLHMGSVLLYKDRKGSNG